MPTCLCLARGTLAISRGSGRWLALRLVHLHRLLGILVAGLGVCRRLTSFGVLVAFGPFGNSPRFVERKLPTLLCYHYVESHIHDLWARPLNNQAVCLPYIRNACCAVLHERTNDVPIAHHTLVNLTVLSLSLPLISYDDFGT